MTRAEIESGFPRIAADGFEITSQESQDYNCIAWAGGDATEKWDPDLTSGRYWPTGVPRTLDLESFMKLYEVEGGYEFCDSDSLEQGVEKIAIFQDSNNEVTHAARQTENGSWTSKLGDFE